MADWRNIHFCRKIPWLTALLFLLFVNGTVLYSQDSNSFSLVEYKPAPGQFINLPSSGTPEAAEKITQGTVFLLSLGGQGGYVVYRFLNPVENDPANPYGVDLTVFGNPLCDNDGTVRWAEPGIISVMRDDNGNGLADDTWYEIAGSDLLFSSSSRNIKMNYTNPGGSIALDVPWSCSDGTTGFISALSFNTQSYYPSESLFPGYEKDMVTFSGTRISPVVFLSLSGEMVCRARAFGYADNNRVLDVSSALPDNPYTPETEGCGGDAIDISWAVDVTGAYVDLDRIDFIRIATGVQEDGRWLGELSTEIRYIRDEAATGARFSDQIMLVINELPESVATGTGLYPEALLFVDGRVHSGISVSWEINDPALAGFEGDELLMKKAGTLVLTASSPSYPGIKASREIVIAAPAALELDPAESYIVSGESLPVTATVTDATGRELQEAKISWSCGDTTAASVLFSGNRAYVLAKNPGTVKLLAKVTGTVLSASATITITAAPEVTSLWFGCNNTENNLLAREMIRVENFDLRPFVDGGTGNYSPGNIQGLTLAHVLAALFDNTPFTSDLRFRENSAGLYLWRYPDIREGYTDYFYGSDPANAARTGAAVWLVMLNAAFYSSGFEKIRVSADDEVWLFRVDNAAVPWSLEQISTDRAEYEPGDLCLVRLLRYEGSLTGNGNIEIGEVTPMVNAAVSIENPASKGSSPAAMTDQNGEAQVRVEQKGELYLSSGVSRTMVRVGSSTGVYNPENMDILAGPNPFSEEVWFRVPGGIDGYLFIYDMNGRLVEQFYAGGTEEMLITVPELQPGLYFFRLQSGDSFYTGKLVRDARTF